MAFVTDGRPILVALAFEWILEEVELDAITSIPKEDFERQIVTYLKSLRSKEDIAVIMMATVDRQLTPQIMSLLTKWEPEECEKICTGIERFSFVKTTPNMLRAGTASVYTLHDEMLRLVREHVDFASETKISWRKQVVSEFYDPAIAEVPDPQVGQTLVAEKLSYLLQSSSVGVPEDAMAFFDAQMRSAIDSYEFEFCELLLSEMTGVSALLDEYQSKIVTLINAEMLVSRYQPFEAKLLFEELISFFNPESDTEYFSRAISGMGDCVANGSTVVEADLAKAIEMLKNSLPICNEKGLEERVTTLLYQLGYCYDLLGQHSEALDYYHQSYENAKESGNYSLIIKTLDDMAVLRLKRYEVPVALELITESLNLKEHKKDVRRLGESYHLMGNAYRDLDEFSDALRWYALAEKASLEVGNELELCELYGDIAWLHLLDENWDEAKTNVNRAYYDYALPRRFGREIAESEHTYYHITLETEGLESALPWIQQAFESAKKYSNTFIYLDAALHLIEAAYSKGELAKIPQYYEQMEELDRKGCGYRMFKGRAACILGDLALQEEKYGEAANYWQDGFEIIAIHGRSRSSVRNFDDYLSERHRGFSEALKECGLSRIIEFRKRWTEQNLDPGSATTLADEYPALLGLCYEAEGDIHFANDNQTEALTSWYKGVFYWALHSVLRPTLEAKALGNLIARIGSNLEPFSHRIDLENNAGMFEEVERNRVWSLSTVQLIEFSNLLGQITAKFFGEEASGTVMTPKNETTS